MQINLRDDEIKDEDDENEWMRTNLYFISRDAMGNYFKYLFQSGGGNGFENAILLDIEKNSTIDKFVEKIGSLKDMWQVNKNLSIYVYNNVLNN